MTPDTFRRLALELPKAIEGAHMGKPDFRGGGRIFATLSHPDEGWGMVVLKPHEQEMLVAMKPAIYRPVAGGWGQRGCTNVNLAEVDETTLQSALLMVWRGKASKGLITRRAALLVA